MSHDHAGHSHAGHSHEAPKDFGRAFLIGIFLNGGFIILEVIFGLLSNSLALLADAGHNLSDVLGLVLAWVASVLAKKVADVAADLWLEAVDRHGGSLQCPAAACGCGRDFPRGDQALQRTGRGRRGHGHLGGGSGHFGEWSDGAALYVRAQERPERAGCVPPHGGETRGFRRAS